MSPSSVCRFSSLGWRWASGHCGHRSAACRSSSLHRRPNASPYGPRCTGVERALPSFYSAPRPHLARPLPAGWCTARMAGGLLRYLRPSTFTFPSRRTLALWRSCWGRGTLEITVLFPRPRPSDGSRVKRVTHRICDLEMRFSFGSCRTGRWCWLGPCPCAFPCAGRLCAGGASRPAPPPLPPANGGYWNFVCVRQWKHPDSIAYSSLYE